MEHIDGIIQVLLGSLLTGIAWVVRSIIAMKKDIDYAHQKLREIQCKNKE